MTTVADIKTSVIAVTGFMVRINDFNLLVILAEETLHHAGCVLAFAALSGPSARQLEA
jgi:hypothetical protein